MNIGLNPIFCAQREEVEDSNAEKTGRSSSTLQPNLMCGNIQN
jgi:hypothetical protein